MDPERAPDSIVMIPLDFTYLEPEDLAQFREQVRELVARYEGSERLTEDLVDLFRIAVSDEADDRAQHLDLVAEHQVLAVVDSTSPPEHTKDDLGHVLAWALRYLEDPATRKEVWKLWARIVVAVRVQRQRLREAGLSQ
jgi:hypothetical protein